jgi:hypothetical protein
MAARLTDGDEQGFAAVHFPASAHTHNHLDDAVEQGELFANVFEWVARRRRSSTQTTPGTAPQLPTWLASRVGSAR